jgi:tetratricopeptide (TPR) repeat protein
MKTRSQPESENALSFESLVEMTVAHNNLTGEYGKTLERDPSPKLLEKANEFVLRGRETGTLLHDPDERWEAQNMLNFWAKILYRQRHAPGDELPAVLSAFASPTLTHAEKAPIVFQAPPEPLDVYVGRKSFLSDLKQRLLDGRDIALCSSPGAGKTLVAAKLAHDPELREKYSDGVLWARLGEQSNVSTIYRKWTEALKIRTNETDWLDHAHVSNVIREALDSRSMLIVLDNAWQSDVALALKLGGRKCAHIITTYLMPVALDFDTQAPVIVPGFSRSDGLRLLTRRAPKAVKGQEDDAEELVDALDNSPLALSLLANYYRRRSQDGSRPDLKQLRRRLLKEKQAIEAERSSLIGATCDDVQINASLLAAISWCFGQLDEEEQYVLQAFSAFPPKPNTFSDAAARFIITEERTKRIQILLDYGLLERSADDRYSLHRAVSVFLNHPSHKLTHDNCEQRMVQCFVNLVNTQTTNLHVLAQEEKNILAALELAHKRGLWEPLVAGTNALFGYFDRQGLYGLAKKTLTPAREAAERSNNERALAAILLKLGEMNERRSEYVDANKHLQTSLEIAKRLGDEDICARALQDLGVVAMAGAQYPEAQRYLTEALELARKIKNTEIECAIETKLGWMKRGLGNFKESRTHTEHALKLAQRFHYSRQAVELKLSLGVLDFLEGNYKQAKKHDLEGLRGAKKFTDKRLQCGLHQALGGVEIQLENFKKAEAHLMKSLHLSMEIGHRWYKGVIWKEFGELRLKQGRPNDAAGAFQKAVEVARDVNSPELLGLALYGLARVAEVQKNYPEARLQGQTSLNIFQSIGHHKKKDVMAWVKSLNGHTSEGSASE